MIALNNETIRQIGEKLSGVRLPRWEELPDFGLYLDQMLMLLSQHLEGYDMGGEKQLTSSMVNNYVKMGAIPAPEKKKYYRPHLALLIVICILKPVVAISQIRDYLSSELLVDTGSELYNRFCAMFEQANVSAAEETAASVSDCEDGDALKQALVKSALRACAERSMSQAIMKAVEF